MVFELVFSLSTSLKQHLLFEIMVGTRQNSASQLGGCWDGNKKLQWISFAEADASLDDFKCAKTTEPLVQHALGHRL